MSDLISRVLMRYSVICPPQRDSSTDASSISPTSEQIEHGADKDGKISYFILPPHLPTLLHKIDL